jgi:hypothetical protein
MNQDEILSTFIKDKTRRTSDVIELQMLDWQYPSLTEKQALFNHSFYHDEPDPSNVYLGFPWATLIDLHTHIGVDLERFVEPIKENTRIFEGRRIHTACQHILWDKLIGVWETVGLTDIHLSHCKKDTQNTERLSFHPWPLIATNYENPTRSEGLVIKEEKKYLASFIGNNTNPKVEIRVSLHEMLKGREDVVCELGNKWFYNSEVYEKQILRKDDDGSAEQKRLATVRYNEVLSESVFSLCPEGSGPNTIRLWESIAVGSIPVVFADNWKPPSIPGIDWNQFSVWIPTKECDQTIQILESIDESTRRTMRNNCLSIYKKFSSMRCF